MLNKNGWGLKEMLALTGVLAIFLIIAIVNIYKLYSNFEDNVTDNYYHDLESDLVKQGTIYFDDYYTENLTSDEVMITNDILKVYDLDVMLMDPSGKACEGYIKANKTRGKRNIKGYVKCANYTTEGY